MHPSCSEYSRRVVEKHGFAIGWMMTLDRLLRCGRDELKTAPKIFVSGQWKYYDPVENNDFWWEKIDGLGSLILPRELPGQSSRLFF